MYNLLKPLATREELLKRKIRIFTHQEFARLFELSPYQTKYYLDQLIKEGLLSRLRRGFYTLKTDPPSEEEIANAIYKPSYISFEYALAYHNIIPEMTYHITSATTRPTQLFNTDNISFAYYTIKPEAYTGYSLVQRGERRFLMAEPEKALVDYLYMIALGDRAITGGKLVNDRMELSSLNKKKIFGYAKLYDYSKLDELIKEVL
jgi:predicted transcriptional regulator of viral defense system